MTTASQIPAPPRGAAELPLFHGGGRGAGPAGTRDWPRRAGPGRRTGSAVSATDEFRLSSRPVPTRPGSAPGRPPSLTLAVAPVRAQIRAGESAREQNLKIPSLETASDSVHGSARSPGGPASLGTGRLPPPPSPRPSPSLSPHASWPSSPTSPRHRPGGFALISRWAPPGPGNRDRAPAAAPGPPA